MPWAAPIGSAKGIANRDALKLLRQHLPDIRSIIDAGIGAPSHAAQAWSWATTPCCSTQPSPRPPIPCHGSRLQPAVEAGRTAYEAGLMEVRDFASPSTPVVGTPFWHAVS